MCPASGLGIYDFMTRITLCACIVIAAARTMMISAVIGSEKIKKLYSNLECHQLPRKAAKTYRSTRDPRLHSLRHCRLLAQHCQVHHATFCAMYHTISSIMTSVHISLAKRQTRIIHESFGSDRDALIGQMS